MWLIGTLDSVTETWHKQRLIFCCLQGLHVHLGASLRKVKDENVESCGTFESLCSTDTLSQCHEFFIQLAHTVN